MGGKSKSPPIQLPPDYAGAAIAQGQANVETATASAKLSNPNVITPYGEQTVQYGVGGPFMQEAFDSNTAEYQRQLTAYQANPSRPNPDYRPAVAGNPWAAGQRGAAGGRGTWAGQNIWGNAGGTPAVGSPTIGLPRPVAPNRADYTPKGDPLVPTVTQTLNPESQALYEQELRIGADLGDIGESQLGNIGEMLGTPFDMSAVPPPAAAGQEAWDNAYQSQIERNQPFQERARDRQVNQLANQGIFQGSEAYSEAMRDLATRETDFNLAAQNNATAQQQAMFGMDTQARQNAITQQAYLRQLPLNELNALLSGTQIQNPQFQQYQGQQIAPPPIFQAEQAKGQQYNDYLNFKNASGGGLTSGLFGLGAAGIGAAGMMFSDRRLKSNITRIGTHPLGIGIYEYDIFGKHDVGVMADEVLTVKPYAVQMMANGYMAVNYRGL